MAEKRRPLLVRPFIDPFVRFVGVSKLRQLNAARLREFDGAMVFQDDDEPLAVMISYKAFLAMQDAATKGQPNG